MWLKNDFGFKSKQQNIHSILPQVPFIVLDKVRAKKLIISFQGEMSEYFFPFCGQINISNKTKACTQLRVKLFKVK